MKKYITKPIGYIGCNPVIAEHLKRNEMIDCTVWTEFDDGTVYIKRSNVMVRDYHADIGNSYVVEGGARYEFATPTERKRQRAKKASEIVKWLENNEYYCNSREWWKTASKGEITFAFYMFQECEKPIDDTSRWLPEWLEEY